MLITVNPQTHERPLDMLSAHIVSSIEETHWHAPGRIDLRVLEIHYEDTQLVFFAAAHTT